MPIRHITEREAWAFILSTVCFADRPRDDTGEASAAGAISWLPGGAFTATRPLEAPARRLLEIFGPLVEGAAPRVIGQLGQSLDGRIATESGASHYINDEAARVHLHRLRAIVDAVVIGVGTLNADDPQLTVRHVEGPNPVRVIVDPGGRADPRSRLFHDAQAPVLLVRRAGSADPDMPTGTQTLWLAPDADDGIPPAALLSALAARGLKRVLVEGGGLTVSRFLQAGALQRLHLLVAPMLIGSGRPGLCLPPIDTLAQALRPPCRVFACGADSLFDLALAGGASTPVD